MTLQKASILSWVGLLFGLGLAPLLGCASTLDPRRPVGPMAPVEAHMVWPDYVTPRDRAVLDAAERRIEEVRKGELLVEVVDKAGWPVQGASVRWEQEAHSFAFGVSSPFDPSVWGALLRIGINAGAALLDWRTTEPEPGLWLAEPTAAAWALDILPQMGVPMRAAATVWPVKSHTPSWARGLRGQALATAATRHVTELVRQIGQHVTAWEVLRDPNGSQADGHGREILSVGRAVSHALRKLAPKATLLVDLGSPLTEAREWSPEEYGRLLDRAGVEFDRVGLQLFSNGYTYAGALPRHTLSALQAGLDRAARLGKPIEITGIAAPSAPHPDDPGHAGYWGERWSPALQAVYTRALYVLGFGHPAVVGLTWRGALDRDTDIVKGGLFQDDRTPRPVFFAIKGLLAAWTTRGHGHPNAQGLLRFRGFGGTYRVVVRHPQTGREVAVTAHIVDRELRKLRIVLPPSVSPARTDAVHKNAVPWTVARKFSASAPER